MNDLRHIIIVNEVLSICLQDYAVIDSYNKILVRRKSTGGKNVEQRWKTRGPSWKQHSPPRPQAVHWHASTTSATRENVSAAGA